MRAFIHYLTASVICTALFCPAQAQSAKDAAKAGGKSAGGSEVRYFASLGDILGDVAVDAFLKETRQNGKIVSSVLDVCYPMSGTSERKDRFVIDLKVDGDKLSGAGQSLEAKTPVTVNLKRKPEKKATTFEGKIVIGNNTSLVSSSDNTDTDEKEFSQMQVVDDDLVEAPKDFTQVSPQSIATRVSRDQFIELIKVLRSENVQIALDSIATDCNALRSGQQTLRLIVDPSRASELVAKLKTLPGVTAAGWTTGTYDMERAVRFSGAGWIVNGKPDREKIAGFLSSTSAKVFGAKPASSKWNDTTGELTFALQRPSALAPELNLTETLEVVALISAEKPGTDDRLVVWLGIPSSKTTDNGGNPRLQFDESSGGDEEGTINDDDGLIKSLATELKGQRWDTDKAAWQ